MIDTAADLLLVLGYAADEQPAVVDGHADAEEAAAPDLVVVHVGDGASRVLAARVRHEAVAAVGAAEVHHQAELVDAAAPLERRHQLVLTEPTTRRSAPAYLFIYLLASERMNK